LVTTSDDRIRAVPANEATIVITSIVFRSRRQGPMDWRLGPIFPYLAELRGTERPKLCFLSTTDGVRLFPGAD
jgi:hypothetical protein